jgi:beta-glucosidase
MKERTYRFFSGKPLWGFGHGLSYTRFAYAAPQVRAADTASPVTLTVQVRNAGDRAGKTWSRPMSCRRSCSMMQC